MKKLTTLWKKINFFKISEKKFVKLFNTFKRNLQRFIEPPKHPQGNKYIQDEIIFQIFIQCALLHKSEGNVVKNSFLVLSNFSY